MENQIKKRALFLDRDGTLVIEPPSDKQLDSLEKLEFYPGVFQWLSRIVNETDFELVMVTNQDGLGTDSFPEEDFWPAHNKIIQAFQNEGITFLEVLIDRSLPEEEAPTRKPRTGMLVNYLEGDYDLKGSFVIGDRNSDLELAKNLGCKGVFLGPKENVECEAELTTQNWEDIYRFLCWPNRKVSIERNTSETSIQIRLNPDGQGIPKVSTGIAFFDHMLSQLAKHSGMDLEIDVKGDLEVDEHHTIEDTALTLGEALNKSLGNKKGLERYGFCLPMDDCLAKVAIDLGGRPWITWEADFNREMIGKMPTEMFFHFFKSFSDAARCNLSIKAEGQNEHHKIEAIFKALAKALKMALKRDLNNRSIPSTKGVLQ